jgi:acyl carrier protein
MTVDTFQALHAPTRTPSAPQQWQARPVSLYPRRKAAAFGGQRHRENQGKQMSDRAAIFETVTGLIQPFNKKGVALSDATTFQHDLEWDSLTVMDFVAAIEDEFDIIITMNMQAEIETVGQLVDAVQKLKDA